MTAPITFREATDADVTWISQVMGEFWGGEPLIIREKQYFPSRLPGIIAEQGERRVGFLFYEIQGHDCEIVVFEVFEKFHGTGTKLLHLLIKIAKKHQCERIYLMTTNDSLDALRFYQRRGFGICGIRIDSMDKARRLKPNIPLEGDYGIPIRDEIDLEMRLKLAREK
jgi:ribosomal protein S18 acetylase RimI-like enzyme